MEAYGKLPSIERVTLSPSGTYAAYVVTNGEKRSIAVQTTADHKMVGVSQAGSEKVRDIRWAGDRHLLITTSTSRQPPRMGDVWLVTPRVEFFTALDLDLSVGRWRGLLDDVMQPAEVRNRFDTTNIVFGAPIVRIVDHKPVAFVRSWYFLANKGALGLFRIDLDSGQAYLADRGGREAYDWAIDGQGQPVAAAAYHDTPGVWGVLLKGPGGWRPAQTTDAALDVPDLVGLTPDGKSVLVRVADEKTGAALRPLALDTGAWGESLPASDAEHAIFEPRSGRLIGLVALSGDARQYTFYDPHDAAVWRTVAKAFPGDLVTLESWSDDRNKVLARVDSADQGPAYALVDLTTHQADWLGAEYDLKEEDISPVKPISYRAADGLEIHGYLTLPRGRVPHGVPLVVLAHGGPASRDTPGFHWWAQALASRGYAVLQTNFRGSDGYGRDFMAAGFGEWGRKMQTDLSDGVRDLVRQGLVDPKRVCIVGASYGGYAALAGATIDHGVYRCAVSVGGVSDLRALTIYGAERQGQVAQRYWDRFIGANSPNDPVVAKYSPVNRAAEADIPVLLVHGRDDTVVPVSQSRRMADALRIAGKPVELVELPGEDHWLSRGDTRLQMLQATVAFLEKNNPPD